MNKYQKEYVEFLRGFLSFNSVALHSGNNKKIKVVFDCSNGTTGEIIKGITDYGLRIKSNKIRNFEFVIINSDISGNFPAHGPNPLKRGAMDQLKKSVLKNKADLGVIFDADGDRAFFIDEKGRWIDPDVIAYLLIWHLKAKKVVVNETTSNIVTDLRLTTYDLRLIHSENGGYAIKNAMIKNKADFGCERSGHYYFKVYNPNNPNIIQISRMKTKNCFYMDSGILAAIHTINAISRLPYKLSDFVDLTPKYYRSGDININFQFSIFNFQKLIKKIEKYFLSHNSRFKILNSSYIDGLRMDFGQIGLPGRSLGDKDGLPGRSLGEGWWFNLQFSNTEPVMRLNLESSDKRVLAKQTKILIGLVRKS